MSHDLSQQGFQNVQSRRTDDPTDPDRRQSFSLSARPGPGIMAEANPVPPVRHSIRDPTLQAMATAAAETVANAVRYSHACSPCTAVHAAVVHGLILM